MQEYSHRFDPSLDVDAVALAVFEALYEHLPGKDSLAQMEGRCHPLLHGQRAVDTDNFHGYYSANPRLDDPPYFGEAVLAVRHDTRKPGQAPVEFEESTGLTIAEIQRVISAVASQN